MDLNATFKRVQQLSASLVGLSDETINLILIETADAAVAQSKFILDANASDLALMNPDDPKFDRLKLTEDRIKGIASDMKSVASLPSPLGRILGEWIRPNGMKIKKISVPFGVIGMIYEARPNVTFDVFSL